MKMKNIAAAVVAALVSAPVMPAGASSLEMMPVMVNVSAPAATSTITLQNVGADPINAQVRVFKWSQINGKDQLTPTRDVVASPPAVKIGMGKNSVIRIVRLAKTPVAGEETYRLVVDEVPKAPKQGKTGVGISLRYSVPVFFSSNDAVADLHWTATASGGQMRIAASNAGARHVRIADLQYAVGGKLVTVAAGLSGYVLGNGQRSWVVKGSKIAAPGSKIEIIAKGDNGPVDATVQVAAGK
jgi:fimbrial chaperone protein